MDPRNTIDANDRQVGLGYAPDIANTIQPLICDDGTFEIHLEIIPVGSLAPGVFPHIEIDGNSRQIAAAVTDDSNETITGLTVDEIVGLPCLRIELV